jgi:hypothetical protein
MRQPGRRPAALPRPCRTRHTPASRSPRSILGEPKRRGALRSCRVQDRGTRRQSRPTASRRRRPRSLRERAGRASSVAHRAAKRKPYAPGGIPMLAGNTCLHSCILARICGEFGSIIEVVAQVRPPWPAAVVV